MALAKKKVVKKKPVSTAGTVTPLMEQVVKEAEKVASLAKKIAKEVTTKKTSTKKTAPAVVAALKETGAAIAKKTPAKKASAPSKKVLEAAPDSSAVEFSLYPTKSYSEEYQVTGFHYAFMSADNKMCHHWVKCRDFLQDALRNQLTGRNDQIYSFAYRPGEDPAVETKETLMLVKRVGGTDKAEFKLMMESALELVNHYEKAHKLTSLSVLAKATHTGKDQDVYLFKGPGEWSQGAVMIALYTFLIRLGHFQPKFKDEASLMKAYTKIINDGSNSNDTKYLKTVYKNLNLALEHRDKHLFTKPGHKKGDKVLFHDSPMNSFHHHSGIVSLSMFNTPEKGLNDEFRKIFAAGK